MLYGRSSPMVQRLGRLMTIIDSLTAKACLVEGFASSMMANEDGMNVARNLLMRQCTPVTYEKVVTHKIESIGGQKSSVARYFDHRRRCQNVKKEPLAIHIKRRSKVGKYQSSRQKSPARNATSGKSKNLVSLIVMHADHGVERCF
jgi:hypothetical protein